jgi:hypothetical protein
MWCGRYDEKLVGAYEVKSAGNTSSKATLPDEGVGSVMVG